MTATTALPADDRTAPKISFVSLGCPKALVDSERIITRLRAEGYELSRNHQGADLDAVIEINDFLVHHADATGRHGASDAPRLGGAVNAKFGVADLRHACGQGEILLRNRGGHIVRREVACSQGLGVNVDHDRCVVTQQRR